jgi:hypothetical protein
MNRAGRIDGRRGFSSRAGEVQRGTSQLQETFLPDENPQIAITRFLQKSQDKHFAAGLVQDDKITRLSLILSLP